MSRPDAALALAAAYMFETKREARVGAVCVAGAGLNAAIFSDIVGRIYIPNVRNGNQALAVGLAVTTPLAPDPPMVKAAVEGKKDNGDPQYPRSIRKLTDTSEAASVLRNGVTFNVGSVVVLSAPATWLGRSLDLLGTKELYKQRVKRLVIVDAGSPQQDPAALNKVVAEYPTEIFFCGRDVGESLVFPGENLDKAFAWAPAHPVVDAYRAFKSMPYDAPLHDLAAVHFAVHPDSGFFTTSEPGTLQAGSGGALKFMPGGGTVRRLTVDPAKKEQALAALIEIATAKPTVAAGRGRGGS